jgi:hypothetical protein
MTYLHRYLYRDLANHIQYRVVNGQLYYLQHKSFNWTRWGESPISSFVARYCINRD